MAPKRMPLLLLLSCVVNPEVLGAIVRPSCASGWFYHRSNCYGYFRKLRNWSDAELECQSYGNGSHLASILNQNEANVTAWYIRGYQTTQHVWIGLHDPQKRQLWQWIDGASYQYEAWSERNLGDEQHCMEMDYRDKFLNWTKNECSERQHFLCKYRP